MTSSWSLTDLDSFGDYTPPELRDDGLASGLTLSAQTYLYNVLCGGKSAVIFDARDDEAYVAGHVKSARPNARLAEFSGPSTPEQLLFRYGDGFFAGWRSRYSYLVVPGRYIADIVDANRKQELEDLRLKELEIEAEQRRRAAGPPPAAAVVDAAAASGGPPPPPPPPPPAPAPRVASSRLLRPSYSRAHYARVLYYAAGRGVDMPELESGTKALVQRVQGLKTRAHELAAGPTQAVVNAEEINYIYPSAVIDGLLYQGGAESVAQRKILDDLGVRHVICAAAELKPAFPGHFVYLHIPVDDTPHDDLFAHFERAYQHMAAAYDSREPLVVHCAMGISRSSTVTLMFLIRHFKLSFERAVALLKDRRPFIQPNPGFVNQLKQWHQMYCS